MLALIPSLDPWLIAYLFTVFTTAGLVKGVSGFGFPLVAVPLASMVAPVPSAIAWALLPGTLANVFQACETRQHYRVLRAVWPLFLGLVITLTLTMQLIAVADSEALRLVLGVLIQVVVFAQLRGAPPVLPQARPELRLATSGAFSGLIGGLTSFYGFPAVQSLLSLDIRRSAFIFATSIFLLTGGLVLGTGLQAMGAVSVQDWVVSTLCLLPTLLGTRLGRVVRDRLPTRTFKRVVLSVLSAVGLTMIVRTLF